MKTVPWTEHIAVPAAEDAQQRASASGYCSDCDYVFSVFIFGTNVAARARVKKEVCPAHNKRLRLSKE